MKTILIVDDNPIVLRMLRDLLRASGFRVHAASNAQQCDAVLRTVLPDAIVLDMQLPETDGFTLAQRLKSDPRTRPIPILAVTSFAMKGDEERARAAGCDAYFSKPIDTRTFPEAVASYCETAAGKNPSLRIL